MNDSENSYLIKRNPSFANSGFIQRKNEKRKLYAEIAFKRPPFENIKIGDLIYVSQKDIGVYAFGKITSFNRPLYEIAGLSQALEFCKNKNDEVWWHYKLIDYHNKLKADPNSKLYYLEFEIDQQLLKKTIPLQGILSRLNKSQRSITKINPGELEFLLNPNFNSNNILSEKIPMGLKMDLYSFFNKNYAISHWIDIDHFVPKSAGGPGNIIENLVPISFNLNRYKSDSIPVGFFKHATNFQELKKLVKDEWLNRSDEFIRKKEHKSAKEACLVINDFITNNWDMEEIRMFYKEVLRIHNPSYVSIIEKFSEK
jgi:hypothetical protein